MYSFFVFLLQTYFLCCLPCSFYFLFVFFRCISLLISIILSFVVFSSDNRLHGSRFSFWSLSLLFSHYCLDISMGFFLIFLQYLYCLVKASGMLFDITVRNNFFHNHNWLLFSLKSGFFIQFTAALLAMLQILILQLFLSTVKMGTSLKLIYFCIILWQLLHNFKWNLKFIIRKYQ